MEYLKGSISNSKAGHPKRSRKYGRWNSWFNERQQLMPRNGLEYMLNKNKYIRNKSSQAKKELLSKKWPDIKNCRKQIYQICIKSKRNSKPKWNEILGRWNGYANELFLSLNIEKPTTHKTWKYSRYYDASSVWAGQEKEAHSNRTKWNCNINSDIWRLIMLMLMQ